MADFTKTILVTVETDTDAARQGMQRFGESLSSNADALNKLRSGIDDTIDGLKLYGERGQRVASQIESITDPTRRLAAAKAALASEARRADSALGRLGNALEATRVNASLALGGSEAVTRGLTLLGGAALVAGGALVTGVVKGIEKYLEADAKASKALDGLTDRFNRLLFTFGEAVVGGDRLKVAFDLVGKVLDELTKKVGENRQQIADNTLGIVNALSYVAEGALKMGLGVQIFFQGIVDSVQYLVQQVTLGYLNLFTLIDKWRGLETSDANKEWLRLVAIDNPFAQTEAMAARLDRLSEGFERLRAGITAVGATPLGEARTYTPPKGGAGQRQPLPDGFTLSTSQVDEVLLLLEIAKEREAVLDRIATGQAGYNLAERTRSRAEERIASKDEGKTPTALSKAIGAASARLGEGLEPATSATKEFQSQMDALTATMVGFGVQSFQAFAAFAVGAKSGKQALGEVLASLGSLAVQTGTFFILAGTASSALPFLGLSGGAAIGAGVGLVALGTGLQLGGAALAASGGGAGRTSVGGGGAGNFSSFGPQLPQAQAAQPEHTEVILVLDGERVGRILAPRLQQLGELGHLRLPLSVGA